ncbi:MAG TPA: M23 family metallopeptidase [Spirochaetota bacterium]|nr:M23 family metallopeptidase [Spirochaetota bacterium]
MNKTLVVSIIILALSNVSFRWPVDNARLTSTFGESRADHFHDGVDMISDSDKVYPVNKGRLVFTWNKSMFPLQNYWGGGNYKIIKHEGNMVSVYMHLQDGDDLKQVYEENEIIGYVGNTGHSYGKHIHFSLLDNVKRESTNPFIMLPRYEDSQPPQILNFYVKVADKYVLIRENSSIRLTRHYPLLVEIRDTVTGKENLGIYRIRAVFNGKDVLDSQYSLLGSSEKGLTLNNRVFNDITDEKGYYMISGITFVEGINSVTVSASDFNGNTAEKVFSIDVHLDIQPEQQ